MAWMPHISRQFHRLEMWDSQMFRSPCFSHSHFTLTLPQSAGPTKNCSSFPSG